MYKSQAWMRHSGRFYNISRYVSSSLFVLDKLKFSLTSDSRPSFEIMASASPNNDVQDKSFVFFFFKSFCYKMIKLYFHMQQICKTLEKGCHPPSIT